MNAQAIPLIMPALSLVFACNAAVADPKRAKEIKKVNAHIAGRTVRILAPSRVPTSDGFFVDMSLDEASPNYLAFFSWEPDKFRRGSLYQETTRLAKLRKAGKEADLPPDMPTQWVQVQKDGGRYYIYDACDGLAGEARVVVVDDIVEIHARWESFASLIVGVNESSDGYQLLLAKDREAEPPIVTAKAATIAMKILDKKANVYTLTVGPLGFSFMAVPLENAHRFPLVINSARRGKTAELPWN